MKPTVESLGDKFASDLFRGMEDTRDAQLGFEEQCVAQLLRRAGRVVTPGERQEATRDYGGLSLQWLYDTCAFPLRLAASKLKHTSGTKIGWVDLFGAQFAKLPWYEEYAAMCAHHGVDPRKERFGLVFNAPHTQGGTFMVMHNQPTQAENPADILADAESEQTTWTRIIRPVGRPPICYVIEQLNSFLLTVGRDWASTQ